MKKLILFLFVLTWPTAGQITKTTTGTWLAVDIKWEHAPPAVNAKLEFAESTVLEFDENGRVAVIECVVNRERGRYITVSQGDGHVVAIGEWNGKVPGRIKYRIVDRTIAVDGEKLPGAWRQGELNSVNGVYLVFEGARFRRIDGLRQSVLELLRGIPDANWK
jgi:uncharacterized protein YuzE